MALEGTIKEFGLADIFQLLGLQKKTGILFLKGEEETINVHFEDGMVVKVEESKKSPKYLIGRILINRGKATEDKLGEALEIQKSTAQKLGGVFITMGLINKDDLRSALTFQMNEAIYRAFRWKSGDYKFYQEKVDFDRDTIVPISSEHILMDGVRMLDEWPLIEKMLPSYEIVLAKKAGAAHLDEEKEPEDIFAGYDSVGKAPSALSREQEAALKLVDGKKSIFEITEYSSLGEFDTCKALIDLLSKGYIVKTGAVPEIMSEAPALPSTVKTKYAPSAVIDRLPYAFIAMVITVALWQVGGTRKIMDSSAKGLESLKAPLALNKLEKIKSNAALYYLDLGSYPESTKSLYQMDYLSKGDSVDPWGTEPVISIDSEGVAVTSAGPDRQFGTPDDINTRR